MQSRLRLRRPADFARLRNQGKTWRHPLVILSVLENGLEHNRYGVITSRRLGKAVRRNRVRRLLREALRSHHEQIRPGYDIVLIARTSTAGQRFAAIRQAVRLLLTRAKLLADAPDAEEKNAKTT